MKAKKSYGQHFLIQPGAAERIADCLEDYTFDYVVEVGPGLGALTKHLVDIPKPIVAVEADKSVIPILYNNFGNHPNLDIVHADFLRYNVTENNPDQEFALIGNFPYNISSQIIFSLIGYRDKCPVMVGMFQKELADRVIAPPGSKTYGVISALAQLFFNGKRVFNLEPGAFNPPPKVKSTVIILERRTDSPEVDYKTYRRLVKMSFSQRRKKLRNTIGQFFSDDIVESNPYFQERPEQLGVDDFVTLVNLLESNQGT